MIRAAKSRLRDTLSEERALRPNDVPGTLLNLALLNLTAEDEALRSSAYNLVHDLSTFFDWNLLSGGPKVSTRDMAIPSNSITYVCALSKSLAASAPHLTLDFLKEWTIGFVRADVPQKTACLQYVVPWIANLGAFAMPTHGDYAGSKKQVEEIIKNLISITTAEQGRLHVVIQQHIWRNIAKSDMYLLDIVVSLLVDTAIDSGVESERTECVAEIFHEISSIAIRGKLVARLRKVCPLCERLLILQTIAQTYLKPSITLWQNPAWIEICALTRINMLLSFQPSDSLGTRLYLPELIHIITLLVGSGSVIMRTMLYKLSVNMLQSLASSRATEDMDGTFLRQALERAQSEEVTRCFGLVKVGNVLEGFDDGPSEHGEVNAALLDRVEHIAGFLGDVLAAAAPSTGK
jgi:neurofibromin 1